MKKKAHDISDQALRVLWCTLDADDSNRVERDEMAAFLKRGETKRATPMKRGGQATSIASFNSLMSMNNVEEAPRTSEIRAELNAAGVPPPTDAELTDLATKFNAWLEAAIISAGSKTKSLSWYHL
jgi:hypothetical protein